MCDIAKNILLTYKFKQQYFNSHKKQTAVSFAVCLYYAFFTVTSVLAEIYSSHCVTVLSSGKVRSLST